MMRWRKAEPLVVRYEQAVYGSFPFWDKGYAILAQSPGVKPEWLNEFRLACQRFGEQPTSFSESPSAMFCLRTQSGLFLIVGVGSPGNDDRGRPGALCFHGLFVTAREFRKARFDPFALASALRREWLADEPMLPVGIGAVPPAVVADVYGIDQDIDCRYLTSVLIERRKIAVESSTPIDRLAERVWFHLPEKVRRRSSVATLAFGNGNLFDLVAFPKLSGVALDRSYVNNDPPPKPVAEASPFDLWRKQRRWSIVGYGLVIVVLVIVYLVSTTRR